MGEGTAIQEYEAYELIEWLHRRLEWKEIVSMCDHFGGQRVYIPKAPASESRNKEIRQKFERILDTSHTMDMTSVYRSLAREHGLTERNIRYILFHR
jgi:Mor family transcriptional regulator